MMETDVSAQYVSATSRFFTFVNYVNVSKIPISPVCNILT